MSKRKEMIVLADKLDLVAREMIHAVDMLRQIVLMLHEQAKHHDHS